MGKAGRRTGELRRDGPGLDVGEGGESVAAKRAREICCLQLTNAGSEGERES